METDKHDTSLAVGYRISDSLVMIAVLRTRHCANCVRGSRHMSDMLTMLQQSVIDA